MKNCRDKYLAMVCLTAVAAVCGSQAFAQESYEWTGGKWAEAAKPVEGTPEGELALVRELFDNGEYGKCVNAAGKFRERYPAQAACEEVYYIAGRAELGLGRHYQAYEWFERQLDQFPSGPYCDRALEREFEVAEAFLGGQKRIVLKFMRLPAKDEAVEILTRIAEHAPGTQLSERALLRIADHHFDNRRWVEAAEAYDALLLMSRKSAQAPYATLQAARATYNSYGGVWFDDTPLLEAEQRFGNFAENYPAAAEQFNVSQILDDITSERAHRLHATGEFYERTQRPKAAVFYYERIVEFYPQTHWAEIAREALARLGQDVPAAPARTSPTPEPTTRSVIPDTGASNP
jgi:outer membrane protein assembly factor BamD (BamD/ComL family)